MSLARWTAGALGLLLGAGDARAQDVALVTEYQPEDCLPRPIPGTLGYEIGRQSIDTNAQAYGAEAIVNQSLSRGSPFALRLNNVYNVARVPAVTQCGSGQQFGTVGLDLFSAASGVQFELPLPGYRPRLFYAGSVTGSAIHYPDGTLGNSRYYTSWAYAGFGYLSSFLAPLAPLLSRDDGLQTMAGDFIAGVALDVPKAPQWGTLNLGYVYSNGFYSSVSSRRLKLFATTLLTQDFSLLSLVRAGAREVSYGDNDTVGQTSLYGKNQVLTGPSALQAAAQGRVNLSTLHFTQHRIGQYVTVSAALALRPDVFLHEGSVGVELPMAAVGGGGEAFENLSFLRGTLGVSEMPALPWYGTEGGRQLYFDVAVMETFVVRRNSPETLGIFPYAQGATEFQVFLDVGRFLEDDQTWWDRDAKKARSKGKKGKKNRGGRA